MTGRFLQCGGEARPRPPDHRQQDRRRQRRPRGPARAHPGGVRQGMPAAQPAGGRAHQGLRLLLRALGRGRFLLGGGSAPQARRPGGRGRREADGEVPREGRGQPRRAARAARARAARRPPDPGGVHLGEDRRRHRRAARRDRQAAAQPDRRQPAFLLRSPRPATAATPSCSRCPTRASTCSRTCSRSRSIPYIGRLAVFRVHQGRMTAGHAALRRRGPQADQGRPPLPAARQDPDRSARGDPRRHLRHRQGRRDPVRPHPARLGRGRARARQAARAADAGVRPRGAAEEARRRAEGVRRAAQDPGRGSVLQASSTTRRPTRP